MTAAPIRLALGVLAAARVDAGLPAEIPASTAEAIARILRPDATEGRFPDPPTA